MEEKVILITTKRELRETLEEMFPAKKSQPSFENEKMTVGEAAHFIDVSYATLCKWITAIKIPIHGKGRTRFVIKSELIEAYKNLQ